MSDFESDIPPGSPVASREDPAPPSSSPVRRSSRLAMRPDHLSPASFLKSKGVSLAAGLQSPQVASLAALMPFIDTSPPYIPPSPPAPPSSVSGKRSCKSVAPPAKRRKGRPPSSQLSSCLPGPPSAPPPNPNPPPNAPVVPPEAPGPSSGPHSLPPLPPLLTRSLRPLSSHPWILFSVPYQCCPTSFNTVLLTLRWRPQSLSLPLQLPLLPLFSHLQRCSPSLTPGLRRLQVRLIRLCTPTSLPDCAQRYCKDSTSI
ncbi:proline-rich receptor-like protein kinase PERK9 [Xiphophorus couchianus]|uniref:proline-rich receptor-like protein kinase PERK9 n=1 Tax=Xiphophorus couchianus TaxID=32473 RepID=UPI0010166B74|nr:proline-rich receptor-like protein kinase PERK9 [Xiphophorus couchianus]